MSDKQTQPLNIIQPRKKSWFGCWGSPDITTTVVLAKARIVTIDNTSTSSKPHAIGRSVPKSADEQAGFGF
jgi:hypothetical protein